VISLQFAGSAGFEGAEVCAETNAAPALTGRRKKTVVIFGNSEDLAVFADQLLELGATPADIRLKTS
jgi:hypothetical protein